MKTNSLNDSSEKNNELLKLEYLIKRRSLELDAVRGELKGEREINSICAAFIYYLISELSENNGDDYSVLFEKARVNELVGKYFALVEDTGDAYKVVLSERYDAGEKDVG